jgi:hypothetical protein
MSVDTHWQAPTTEPTNGEPEPADARWKGWLALGLVLLVGGALVAAVTVGIRRELGRQQTSVERTTFVDSFGRQCTQVRAGNTVALDCDYKPIENRVGRALGLNP